MIAANLNCTPGRVNRPSRPVFHDEPNDTDSACHRAGNNLIPFDVISCHSAGGFLAFIEETSPTGIYLVWTRNAGRSTN